MTRFGPDGRYQLGPLLGSGTGGVVYRAFDEVEARFVALKQLTRRRTPEELDRRFASLSRLRHPNLVALHAMHARWEPPFYTMQFVPGVDVISYVRGETERPQEAEASDILLGERRRASEGSLFRAPSPGGYQRARRALVELCAGLTYAHEAGFVHRDVTRVNVRVTAEERLVVMDYGLTAMIGDPTPSGAPGADMIGTVDYMAPEQWDQHTPEPALDWYAVGVVLFEALCGVLPFAGSAHEVLMRKRTVGAPSLSLLLPEVPPDLDAICRGLLQSDPTRRWGAAQVLERLELEAEHAGPETERGDSVWGLDGTAPRGEAERTPPETEPAWVEAPLSVGSLERR
ncbi:MAG: serine/threonine protein kinase [Polyangiaceae bacterium]|nr:serine/threonine protein kinase [Polyangiaceae bacterium]MCW5789205.1 serine/threonine protein kinase [Polyangiaceae bacterium]